MADMSEIRTLFASEPEVESSSTAWEEFASQFDDGPPPVSSPASPEDPSKEFAAETPLYHLLVVSSGEMPVIDGFFTREELDKRLTEMWGRREEARVYVFKGELGAVCRSEADCFSAFVRDCKCRPQETDLLEDGYLGRLELAPDATVRALPSVATSEDGSWQGHDPDQVEGDEDDEDEDDEDEDDDEDRDGDQW